MSSLNFDLILNEKDFPEFDILRSIIIAISEILEHQFMSNLSDNWLPIDTEISVSYYSQKSIQALKPFDALPRVNGNSADAEITKHKYSTSDKKKYYFRKEFDPHQFKDLASAEIDVDEGRPFAIPMYDSQRISSARKQEVHNILLDMYYEGLKEVAKCINADLSILKKAYEATKFQAWFMEQPIGEIVCSRGKNPSKAQLIARWEPDYIFHSARIFEEDGSTRDILFMIYWSLVSGSFFNNPGRLSWVNKDTLKFIPNHREDYRFVFDINKGPIDFSYYFDPPRYRSTKFYAHLVADHEPYERKVLYLN